MTRKNLFLLLKIFVVAAIYFAAAKLGLSLAFLNKSVSPVWPPTGIAIAAVLLLGYRMWPGILLGAFLVNLLTPVPVGVAAGIALGNTLEALSAGYLLRSFGFRTSFDRARDVFKFVLVSFVCTMVSATIGDLALCLGDAARWQEFGALWSTWWLGDLMGALALTPLFLTWGTEPGQWFDRNKLRYVETALLWTLISLSAMAAFGKPPPLSVEYYSLARLIVPLFLWAAFRLGPRGVTLATILLSVIAVWGTAHGTGLFAGRTANEALLQLQVFVGSNAVIFLFLVAVVEERRRSQERLRENERRLASNLAIARILTESPALDLAMQRILRTIGNTLGWDFGAMWIPHTDGKSIRFLTAWHSASANVSKFEAITKEGAFKRDAGLPGRVWSNLKPAWIPDVTKDDNFPRAPFAVADGLHAAFAFPIMFGDKLLGVMEFFSHEIREPDQAMLTMFAGIGNQIGQFMQRKGAENDLEFISRLPQENPEPVIRLDRGRVLTYANPSAQQMLESLSLTLGDEAPPDTVQAALNALSTGNKHELEIAFDDRTYAVTFVPLSQANYVNLYFSDITKRKSAEAALRQLATIVESSDDAIVGKDLNGIIRSWNTGAQKIFGYSAPEMIGKSITILIPSDRQDEETKILAQLRRGERIRHYETVRVTKDGRMIDVSLTISPIRDAEGKVTGASKIARDITQKKRAEAEREQLLQREHAARAEAEAANRIKDEFLATLSHELRTPLNAIVGWVGMLRAGKLNEPNIAHAIEIIDRNARAQAQLIDDILDVSRIVSGKIRLEIEPVELSKVVEAAVDSVRLAAQAKNIHVRTAFDPGAGPVAGDPDRLQQVIWNLLSNAMKFTSEGGSVIVEVRSSGSHIEILVKDTGEGISPNFLPFVFERFRQADGSLTRDHKGLGLGLAIVRHLVELHGGSVRAESEGVGKGSTFKVSLPVLAGQTDLMGGRRQAAIRSPENGAILDGLHVLLIDDENDARELHSIMLRNFGAQVEATSSGPEGLETLKRLRPDVLVCDLEMPGMDGYSFIREVREGEQSNGNAVIPAVALTAHARIEDRERALHAGFQAHLAKPVDPAELGRVLLILATEK